MLDPDYDVAFRAMEPTKMNNHFFPLESLNTHTGYHRKLSCQLKPPHVVSDADMYSKVSSDMTSMIGATTRLLQFTKMVMLYLICR
jgi:hypothetical protein